MRPSHLSYAFLGGFLAAIFFLQWWQSPTYPWWVWAGIGILLAGLGTFIIAGLVAGRRPTLGRSGTFITAGRRPALGLLATTIIGIAFAFWTVSRTTHTPSPMTVDSYSQEEDVSLRGIIADDPDRRATQTNYILNAQMIRTGTRTVRVEGKVLVTVRIGNPEWEYGDDVIVRGVLEQPESTDDFQYDRYLSLKNVYGLMHDPRIERVGNNRGNTILKGIYRFKNVLEERITLLLPEPHASLLAGLLLGSRGSMPEDLVNDFKTTGLTHLVAISGYNITMLITVMGTLLFWLPLKWRFWPSVTLIVLFTILTGASASAVRAAVMGILGLLALQLNRIQTTRLTVLWSAFVMLAWNPKQLWYDAGFQLSFLALIGVLEISPLMKPYLRRVPEFLGIQESFCLTLSAQMLASPWILFLFGQFSVIAPVSNLLAPPAVPWATLLGLLSILLGSIWLPLGRIAAVLAWLPLQWITGIAQLLSSIPFASLTLPGLPAFWIVTYYLCLAGWIIRSSPTHISEPSSSHSSAAQSSFPSAVVVGTQMHAR